MDCTRCGETNGYGTPHCCEPADREVHEPIYIPGEIEAEQERRRALQRDTIIVRLIQETGEIPEYIRRARQVAIDEARRVGQYTRKLKAARTSDGREHYLLHRNRHLGRLIYHKQEARRLRQELDECLERLAELHAEL